MTAKLRLLLVDACVLIDFAKSDSSVITLASRYVGDVHVATPVFEEVHDLDPAMAASLGIKLFEPPLEMLVDAAARRGRLSFQDRLCLLAAKANGWTCVSNDRRLRESCAEELVPVMWGRSSWNEGRSPPRRHATLQRRSQRATSESGAKYCCGSSQRFGSRSNAEHTYRRGGSRRICGVASRVRTPR